MSLASKSLAAAKFEFARSLTPGRLASVAVLSLFPPSISLIVSFGDSMEVAPVVIGATTMIVGLLALLLWATPIVQQELEGKTWGYVAVRPQGKLALVFGKYLIAVGWTMTVCAIAVTLSVLINSLASPSGDHLKTWIVFMPLVILAAFAYASIFLLIGVLFHRRAMVLAVGYSIGAEFVLANIPAVINQFTMRHHLTALAVKWLDFDFIDDRMFSQLVGTADSDWWNLLVLIGTPTLLLCATVAVIYGREYITADEN